MAYNIYGLLLIAHSVLRQLLASHNASKSQTSAARPRHAHPRVSPAPHGPIRAGTASGPCGLTAAAHMARRCRRSPRPHRREASARFVGDRVEAPVCAFWLGQAGRAAVRREWDGIAEVVSNINNMDATHRNLKVGHQWWTILGTANILTASQKPW